MAQLQGFQLPGSSKAVLMNVQQYHQAVPLEKKDHEETYFIYMLDLKQEFRNPANWSKRTQEIAKDHHQYFIDLEKAGKLVIAGRTKYEVDNPQNFGIMVFKAPSLEEARKILKNDPGVIGNLMNAKLHPFSIAVLKTDYD